MAYIGTQPKDVRSFGRAKFDFTATQGQTAFTGADDDSKTLGFTDGQIEVYVNGILMDESDFTTTSGNTVTLASAANLNDIISIVAMQTDIPNSDYVPASGGTFAGNVTFSGLDLNGTDLILDADGDSKIEASVDDVITVTSGGSERARFDTSGNLLIGHTSQDIPVDNGGAGVTLRPAGIMLIGGTGTSIYANREDTDGEIVQFRKDGSTIGSIGVVGSNNLYLNGDNVGIGIGDDNLYATNNAGAASDATLDIGDATVRFRNSYLSGGVYLGGTGSANYLDDYEEGTWTPAPSSGTMSTGTAWYIKIGHMVHCGANIYNFSDRSSNNHVRSSVPFPSRAGATATGSMIGRFINTGTQSTWSPYLSASDSSIYFYRNPSDHAYTTLKHSDLNNSNSDLHFHITYYAA